VTSTQASFARISAACSRRSATGSFHAANDGALTRLRAGELAPPDCVSVWCRPGAGAPWRFELLLDSSDAGDWLFRRDPAIRRPLADLVSRTPDGCPYVQPEVQLLYKAKQRRAKDEADFAAVAPLLGSEASHWLHAALERVHPGHPWLARL
jgi:hypothetical protein